MTSALPFLLYIALGCVFELRECGEEHGELCESGGVEQEVGKRCKRVGREKLLRMNSGFLKRGRDEYLWGFYKIGPWVSEGLT
nr:hypothetical protein [Tanacetum cinerariifolium]